MLPTARKATYLLESLVEVALLEQLKDVSLLRLEVQVSGGDGSPCSRTHCLDNARGDSCLLLLHGQAHFSFNDSLHLSQNRLLKAKKKNKKKTTKVSLKTKGICCTMLVAGREAQACLF